MAEVIFGDTNKTKSPEGGSENQSEELTRSTSELLLADATKMDTTSENPAGDSKSDTALSSMSTADLQEHIGKLSLKPALIAIANDDGSINTIMVPENAEIEKLKVNGQPIDLSNEAKYAVQWGEFDAEKAGKNKQAFKDAYSELLRRADNPVDTDGNPVSMDQLKEMIETRTRSLKDGVDYLQEGKKVVDDSGAESTVYPELDPTRRVEMHAEIVSALKTMTDPATLRMEYAMRMETLGDRESASKAYQEATQFMDNVPRELIDKEDTMIETDKVNLSGQPVRPFGGETQEAAQYLRSIDTVIDGNEILEDTVLDYSMGLNGSSYFMDARKYGIPSLATAYGLDDLHSVLNKRSTMFHLAPKYEQTKSWRGVPKFFSRDGNPVTREELPPDMPVIPHGTWTFGNSDSYLPESQRNRRARELSERENMPYSEARKEILRDQLEALKMVERFENARGSEPRDSEEQMLYDAAIRRVDARATDRW